MRPELYEIPERYKITIIAILLTGCLYLTYYTHAILKTGVLCTHFFYIPIVLSSFWWKRKGIAVAACSGVAVILSSAVFLEEDLMNNFLRVSMFVVISSVVALLSERIAKGEKEVRKSEEKYRSIFEDSVEGIFRTTPEGKFITANRALAQIHGYDSPEELIETITDIGNQLYADPEDRLVMMTQLKEHGVLKGFETPFYRKDGSRIWGSLSLRTVYDEKGTLLYYEGMLEDITDRRQAEDKLREEKALKSSILDSIPHAVIGVRERRITFASDGAETVFGWKPEELIGKDTRILYQTDEEYKKIGSLFYPVLRGDRTHGADDVYARRKDGRNIICRLTAARIGETLKGKEAIATFEDITEHKLAEEAQQQHAHALDERVRELSCLYGISSIVENPDILFKEALQGIAELIPPAWQYPEITCAQIIIDEKEFKTANFKETKWSLVGNIAAGIQSVGSVKVCYLEERPERNEGVFLREEKNLINAVAGQIGRIVQRAQAEEELKKYRDHLEAMVAERTAELRKINQQLKRSEEQVKASLNEKETLLAEIHHRVKNNLQIISSLLDLRAMRTDNQQVIDLFEDARSKIHTMALIHSQLYQSQQFGRVEMKHHIMELVDYLAQIYAMGRRINSIVETNETYLSLNYAIPCALVINELVSNAFRHAFKGRDEGSIGIYLQKTKDGKIILTVKDDGVGLPEDIDIFKTDTLGLKLVTNTVKKQLNGELKIERDAGTTIIAELNIMGKEKTYHA